MLWESKCSEGVNKRAVAGCSRFGVASVGVVVFLVECCAAWQCRCVRVVVLHE